MALNTVTYTNPVAGTVPPSQVQMLPLSRVVATIPFADADTQAIITHNMNIPLVSTPSQHGQNSGSPIVSIGIASGSLGTVAPVIAFTRGTNTVTLAKISATGSNSTVEVQIERYEPIE